jgi:hypothetical protein
MLLLFFFFIETSPTIIFTYPVNKQEFFKDEDIDVRVIITDLKGKKANVQLHVDQLFIDELANSPYYFTIPAGTIPPGEHIVKISTMGVDSLRTITIKNLNSESDNFITFTSGIIPPELKVNGWLIRSNDGVDDKFSLYTYTRDATISTQKKCSKIEFYMKGLGTINLYMDDTDQPWQIIHLGENPHDPQPQNWKLYEFECPGIYHTFIWEFKGNFPNIAAIDAIRFTK